MSEHRVKIFISYSHKDKESLSELKTHLASLRELIETFTDEGVLRSRHKKEIDEVLVYTDIVVFLFSADFIASDSCIVEWELAKEKDKVRLPIIIRECNWKSLLKGEDDIIAVMPDDKAVLSHENKDYAWNEARIEIERLAKEINPSVVPKSIFSLHAAMHLKATNPTSSPLISNSFSKGRHTVGLGILSWKGEGDALRVSLNSHRDAGLLDLFDDVVVLFQGIDGDDRALAAEFGVRAEDAAENIGSTAGMVKVAELLNTDYLLYLEHDTRTIADSAKLREQLAAAVDNMQAGTIRCYLTDPEILADLRKGRLLKATAYNSVGMGREMPPTSITCKHIKHDHWSLSTSVIQWSNIAAFFSRKWFLGELIPEVNAMKQSQVWTDGHLDLEATLEQSIWWHKQQWRVGIADGNLFDFCRPNYPAERGSTLRIISLPRKPANYLGYTRIPHEIGNPPGKSLVLPCVVRGSGAAVHHSPADNQLRQITEQVEKLWKEHGESAWRIPVNMPNSLSGTAEKKAGQVRGWLGLDDKAAYEFEDYRRLLEQKGVLIIHSKDAPDRWGKEHPLSLIFSERGSGGVWRLEHPFVVAFSSNSYYAPLIYISQEVPEVQTRALFHALWHVVPRDTGFNNGDTPWEVLRQREEERINDFVRACLHLS